MKVIKPGYEYELPNYVEPNTPPNPACSGQIIKFIQREPSRIAPVEKGGIRVMNTTQDGTTNEEVLTMLLNRITVLNTHLPCTENILVAHHLELALTILCNRTAERQARGVEGTAQL